MQNISKKDSDQRSAESSVPWVIGRASLQNTTESATEHWHNEKQLNSMPQDQDSSSILSTGRYYHEVATFARRGLYTDSNTFQPDNTRINGTYGKLVEGCLRSSLECGTATQTIRQSQFDHNPLMACLSYPCTDPHFGGLLAACGQKAVIYPQIMGIASARVPLPIDLAKNEPIYVNAKQYRGILRRRQIRAKLEAQNKLIKTRKLYLHESRHHHALKRARGSGGRFLNTKNLQLSKPPPLKSASGISRLQLGANISGFDIHQSENDITEASTPTGSDVTSIFNGDDMYQLQEFGVSHYPPHRGASMQGGKASLAMEPDTALPAVHPWLVH